MHASGLVFAAPCAPQLRARVCPTTVKGTSEKDSLTQYHPALQPPVRGRGAAVVASAHPAGQSLAAPARRQVLLSGAGLAVAGFSPDSAVSVNGRSYPTIQSALDAAEDGATLLLSPGVYRERLVLARSCVLQADAGQPQVLVIWETNSPYESTVQVEPGVQVELVGISLRHSSPSVANNYAVFSRGATCRLEYCDISSSTGSGIGVEGGSLVAAKCSIQSCARHGLVAAADLEQSAATVTMSQCTLSGNKLNGGLFLDGATGSFVGCRFDTNGQAGLELRDCSVDLDGCSVQANKKASITTLASSYINMIGTNNIVKPTLVRR